MDRAMPLPRHRIGLELVSVQAPPAPTGPDSLDDHGFPSCNESGSF
jgi:hypothetical protein